MPNVVAAPPAVQHNLRIDSLRFLAAALVLVHHAGYFWGPLIPRSTPGPFRTWVAHGDTGVTLFLVLSGFLFGRIALSDPSRELIYWRFIQNRVLRIFPLLAFVLLTGMSVYREKIDSLFFLTVATLSFEHQAVIGHDMLGPLWTIGVEFKFYLMFPLLVRAFGTRRRMWLGAILIIVLVRALTLEGLSPSWPQYQFTMAGRLDQILIGVVLSLVFEQLQKVGGKLVSVLALPLGLAWMELLFFKLDPWKEPWNHLVMAAYPLLESIGWSIILYGVLTFPLRTNVIEKALGRLGEVSYSMYLLHAIVLFAGKSYARPVLVPWDREINMIVQSCVLGLPVALLLSKLTYEVIEKPFLAMRVPYFRKQGSGS